jgi:predicted nucleic acid-binding protein
MLLVIADTSPVRYLVQIGQIDLLERLFEKIMLPSIVADELRHPSAPPAVQAWMKQLPGWAEVLPAPELDDSMLKPLDPGERSAIALGLSLKADVILIDERKGAAVALNKGFEVAGTLGVLDRAAVRGLVSLRDAVDRLKRTNFRYRPELIAALLKKREDEGGHT